MKRNNMAQWMNLHRNNSFINRMQLFLLCEKSGAILLVLVGLSTVNYQHVLCDFQLTQYVTAPSRVTEYSSTLIESIVLWVRQKFQCRT